MIEAFLQWFLSFRMVERYWLIAIPVTGLTLFVFRRSRWYAEVEAEQSDFVPPISAWIIPVSMACGAAWPITMTYLTCCLVWWLLGRPVEIVRGLRAWAQRRRDDARREASEQAKASASKVRCYGCGTAISQTYSFCPLCGADQTKITA